MATKFQKQRAKDFRDLIGGDDESDIPAFLHTEEMAKMLNVTPRHMAMMVTKGILEKSGPAQYNTRQTVLAYIAYKSKGGNSDLDAEKLRLARANAEKIELANAKANGLLAPLDAVEREWVGVLRGVRSAMLAMPSRVAQRLGHLSAHDIAAIDREVRDSLEELSADD